MLTPGNLVAVGDPTRRLFRSPRFPVKIPNIRTATGGVQRLAIIIYDRDVILSMALAVQAFVGLIE